MEKLLVFMMLFPFTLLLLFQPALDRMEEGREKVVQVAIQRGIERAAIEGGFTQENKDEMFALLSAVGYKESEIEFNGTESLTLRGDYVEGSLKVPNIYQFFLFENMISRETSEKFHFHSASRMSEYVY